jgi:hypothetical protein
MASTSCSFSGYLPRFSSINASRAMVASHTAFSNSEKSNFARGVYASMTNSERLMEPRQQLPWRISGCSNCVIETAFYPSLPAVSRIRRDRSHADTSVDSDWFSIYFLMCSFRYLRRFFLPVIPAA